MAEDPISRAYPGNSHRGKQPEKSDRPKLDKIVSDGVRQRKTPLGKRIASTFTGADARSVGQYVLFDVILPAIKDLIFDASTQGLQQTLFGNDPRVSTRRNSGQHVGYSKMSTSQGKISSATVREAAQTYREIILPDRGAAEKVLDTMSMQLDQYDQVTVSDLYDLVGITGSFTDNNFGWTNLSRAKIVRVGRDEYLLDMPGVEDLR